MMLRGARQGHVNDKKTLIEWVRLLCMPYFNRACKSWNHDLLCTHNLDDMLLLDILGYLETRARIRGGMGRTSSILQFECSE